MGARCRRTRHATHGGGARGILIDESISISEKGRRMEGRGMTILVQNPPRDISSPFLTPCQSGFRQRPSHDPGRHMCDAWGEREPISGTWVIFRSRPSLLPSAGEGRRMLSFFLSLILTDSDAWICHANHGRCRSNAQSCKSRRPKISHSEVSRGHRELAETERLIHKSHARVMVSASVSLPFRITAECHSYSHDRPLDGLADCSYR